MGKLSHSLGIDTSGALKSMDDLAKDVDQVTKKLKENEKSARSALGEFRRLTLQAIQALRQLNQTLKQLGATMSATGGFGKLLGNIVSKNPWGIAIQGAELLSDAIRYNIQTASEFEQTLHQLTSITKDTAGQYAYFSERAIELGRTTTQTASLVAQAFKIIALKSPLLIDSASGLTAVTQSAITLAEAAGIDVPEAATALTNVLNQFGYQAADAQYIIDTLAQGSRVGAGSIEYLSEALVQCGSVAKSIGVTMEQTVGLLEMLAQGGFQPGQAGRQVKNILILLETKTAADNLKPSVVGITEALRNLGTELKTTEDFKNIFGRENIAAAQYLKDNVENLVTLFDKLKDSAGVAGEQQINNTNTFQTSVVKLTSAWEGLNLQINQSNGLLKKMTDGATWAINKITDIIAKANHNDFVKKLGEMPESKAMTQMVTEKPQDKSLMDEFNKKYSDVRGKDETDRIEKQQKLVEEYIERAEKRLFIAQKRYKDNSKIIEGNIDNYSKVPKDESIWAIGGGPEYLKAQKAIEEQKKKLGEYREELLSAQQVLDYFKRTQAGLKLENGSSSILSFLDGNDDGPKKQKDKNASDLYDDAIAKRIRDIASLEAYDESWKTLQITNQEEVAQHQIDVQDRLLDIWKTFYRTLTQLDYVELTNLRGNLIGVFGEAEQMVKNLTAQQQARKDADSAKKQTRSEIKALYDKETAPKKKSRADRAWEKTTQEWDVYQIQAKDVTLEYLAQFDPKKHQKELNYLTDLSKILERKRVELEDEMVNFEGVNFEGWKEQFAGDPEALQWVDTLIEKMRQLKTQLEEVTDAEERVQGKLPGKGEAGETKVWAKNLGKVAGGVGDLANSFGSFGGASKEMAVAMSVISTAATISQLIASMVMTMTKDPTVNSSIWGWIAAGLSATAALITMTANIKNAGSFAQGGIVKGQGNMTVGDQYWARVNGGEAVLTKSDQSRFMRLLDGGGYYGAGNQGATPLTGEIRIKGSDLYVALTNYGKIKPNGIKF